MNVTTTLLERQTRDKNKLHIIVSENTKREKRGKKCKLERRCFCMLKIYKKKTFLTNNKNICLWKKWLKQQETKIEPEDGTCFAVFLPRRTRYIKT